MNKHIYFGQTIAEVINVKNNSKNSFFKEKAFLSLTLVTILALAGVITVASVINRQQKNPLVDLNETESTSSYDGTTPGQVMEGTTPNEDESNVHEDESTSDSQGVIDAGDGTEEPTVVIDNTQDETQGVAVDVNPVALMFGEEDVLGWPVEGNIILEFSMDGSIYFPTLEQYKYNPAMLIQSEVNTPVYAAADCVIKEIGTNEEIGTYVVMSLGSDYELTYGQLKSLEVSEGDKLTAGAVIGYVAEPTKYYVVEGCNLYVKLMQGDTPVDPLDYIR